MKSDQVRDYIQHKVRHAETLNMTNQPKAKKEQMHHWSPIQK